MRYWSFMAAKVLMALAISYGLLKALVTWWPSQRWFHLTLRPQFGYDLGYTFAIGLWFLATLGMIYLCFWDQKYRCRVCLRRLRMPVLTGSWSRMLQMGRPEIEYICIYGHGRLNVSELQFTGKEDPAWTPQADYWEELTSASRKTGGDPPDYR
jgi:hypothetical protein